MQCHNIKPSVRKGACGRREGNGILFNPSVEEGGEGRKKSSKLGRSRVPVGVPGGEGRTASMKVFLCRKGNKVLGSEHGAGGESCCGEGIGGDGSRKSARCGRSLVLL